MLYLIRYDKYAKGGIANVNLVYSGEESVVVYGENNMLAEVDGLKRNKEENIRVNELIIGNECNLEVEW